MQLGLALLAVAVMERLTRGNIDCPLGQKKVAIVERWSLVEVLLSFI